MDADRGTPTEVFEKIANVERIVGKRFVQDACPRPTVVKALSPSESQALARSSFASSKGANLIDEAMRAKGLVRNSERAIGYSVFSRKLGRPKVVCAIPYSSLDPDSKLVGGIGLSEGQPASGVIVELSGTVVSAFTVFDPAGGELNHRRFEVGQLTSVGIEGLAREPRVKREAQFVAELEPEDSATISAHAFGVLVTDEHSSMIHSPNQIAGLMGNAGVVRAISQLQYMRLIGRTHSPASSCCCCCCCCWGSCSSCSAVATGYVDRSSARGN